MAILPIKDILLWLNYEQPTTSPQNLLNSPQAVPEKILSQISSLFKEHSIVSPSYNKIQVIDVQPLVTWKIHMLFRLPLNPLLRKLFSISADSNGTWRSKQLLEILAPEPIDFRRKCLSGHIVAYLNRNMNKKKPLAGEEEKLRTQNGMEKKR